MSIYKRVMYPLVIISQIILCWSSTIEFRINGIEEYFVLINDLNFH